MTVTSIAAIQQGDLLTVAAFLCSMLLLDAFDISLPRGDSVGVSGSIGSAATIFLSTPWAFFVCTVPLAVLAFGRHLREPARVVATVAVRAASVATAVLLGAAAYRVGGMWARALVAPASFLFAELVLTQVVVVARSPRSLGRQIRGNMGLLGSLLAAQLSAAVLVVVTYEDMGAWSLVPVTALLLLIRQSYALLLDIRESFRTTVEVLVEVAERDDPRLRGHADRTAEIARTIAMRMGLSSQQVETISYAALLHDVDAVSPRTHASLDGEQSVASVDGTAVSLDQIGFFEDIVPILRLLNEPESAEARPTQSDVLSAFIVGLATDADSATNPEVSERHGTSAVHHISELVSLDLKARAVAAAIGLGYSIPAVR